jgi:hypothetical protein
MVVRTSAIRPTAGFSTIAKTALKSLALAGGLIAFATPAIAAAPTGWSGNTPRSVLVPTNGRRLPAPYASQSGSQPMPQGIPPEEIAPGTATAESFDSGLQGQGVIVGSPEGNGDEGVYDGSYDRHEGSYDTAVEGVYSSPFNGSPSDGSYGNGFDGQEAGPLHCGVPGCQGDCNACQQGSGGLPEWRYNAECEPMGLLQKMYLLHRGLKSDGCWTGRVDALILSRNAPSNRPLYTFNSAAGGTALNANQLESIASVGPRLSLFHTDSCGNASWESTYIYSGGFVAERNLPPTLAGYQLAAPGIYGIDAPNPDGLDAARARLTSSLQSAELNRRWCWGSCTQFLAGFRWLQWQETVAITDAYAVGTPDFGQDVYTTGAYNNLFGGQIGLDTLLWQPSKHFRLEGLVKAGAYYNSAYQSSSYQNFVGGVPFEGSSASTGSSPAVCSFAGELGFTGVVPISCNLDFRFGYFGLWLTSLAQPTNQLSGQFLIPAAPTYSSLTTNGNVVLQGLSLGLEGRW